MMSMLGLMYVAVGGAVGSMGRYLIMSLVTRFTTLEFPFGTLAVNILGAFLMGLWIAVVATTLPNKAKDLHLLLAVGVLGGFTTFSTFSMDVFLLLERGFIFQTALYVLGSVVLSVVALLAGMWCIRLAVG
jgi:fluoride exporter